MHKALCSLLLVSAIGCGKEKAAAPLPLALPPSPQAQAAAPAAEPAPAGGGAALTGKVLERIDAPPYSYLRLQTASGEQWAAVNQIEAKTGDEVAIGNTVVMTDFESKTLKRRFDSITFGNVVTPGAAAAAPKPTHAAMGDPGADHAAMAGDGSAHTRVAAAGDVKVAKAEGAGAVTIAELFAGRAALKDTEVTVRGKVVKVNSGIMNKTWIHIQDGTGSQAGGDHDLTVTTGGDAKVGDVITVKGPVHVDKDFGAGYAYAVIIEDARVE